MKGLNLKCRIIPTLIIFFIFYSCVSVAKIATGFKNPTVYDLSEIEVLKNNIFQKDKAIDLVFKTVKDSSDLINIISNSFNGQVNIYSSEGERLCFKNKSSCNAYQLSDFKKNDSSAIGLCDNKKANSNLTNILSNTSYYNLSKSLDISTFNDLDYIFVFYWSDFIASNKNTKDEFTYMKNTLDSVNLKYKILRINCDLRDDWGLEKGKKLPLKFKKVKNRRYNLVFGEIPWKK